MPQNDTLNRFRFDPSLDSLPDSPGPPPKPHRWWQIRKRMSPDAKILLSKERVDWGWRNYNQHHPFLKKINLLAGDTELQVIEDELKADRVMYLDRLAGIQTGIKKSSKEYRDAVAFLTDAGRRYQKKSKYFTDTAMYEVQARSMGFAKYPRSRPNTQPSIPLVSNINDDTGDRRRQQKYSALDSVHDVREDNRVEPPVGPSSHSGASHTP